MRGTPQPHQPSAGGGDRATRLPPVQGRSRLGSAMGLVPRLRHLLPAPGAGAPAPAPAGSDPGYGLGQAMAVVHTRDGGRVACPRVVTERSTPGSGAAGATATASRKTGLR